MDQIQCRKLMIFFSLLAIISLSVARNIKSDNVVEEMGKNSDIDITVPDRDDILKDILEKNGGKASLAQILEDKISNEKRQQLLQETIKDAQLSYSMAQEIKKTHMMQENSFSGLSSSANKRPSELASQEAAARIKCEDMVSEYEDRLIDEAGDGLSEEEKRNLRCIHILGELSRLSELDIFAEAANCPDVSVTCDPSSPFRTIDGSCNNLENTVQGMATQPFRRLLAPYYEDGIEQPKGRLQAENCLDNFCIGQFDAPYPSARLISSIIEEDTSAVDLTEPVTHMVMQWGQFLDHDLGLAPEMEHEGEESPFCKSCEIEGDCEPIRIPEDDPVFGNGKGSTQDGQCLHFRRSAVACSPNGLSPREQINDLTSYLDGSQIYGSRLDLSRQLRTLSDGKMKTSRNGNRLPVLNGEECSPQTRCFLAGDVRSNEQVGLTAMHTLFIREHNRIAEILKNLPQAAGMEWDDERIYQEARKIVGAMLQKITYEDYLPLILGSEIIKLVLPEYQGYKKCANAAIPNVFATAAYRYGHSLVRPEFARFTTDQYENGPNEPLNLRNSFFNIEEFEKTNLAAIIRGLVTENALRNDEFLNIVMTTQLFQRDDGPGMDLAALNIQRGRDHGLPNYGSWTSYCQSLFKELPIPQIARHETRLRLLQLYGSIENADIFVIGASERRLSGSLFGPTFACLFGVTFSDLRDGDRFYYENEGVFTPLQLAEIQKATLSRIICDNVGAINQIQPNAFVAGQDRVNCDQVDMIPELNFMSWGTTGGDLEA